MASNILLQAFNSKHLHLNNRIAMAPLTRCRAINNVVNEMHVQYYSLRADTGLIITEGTPVSPEAIGYPDIPGIYTAAQIEAWKKVTEGVHRKNGKIFVQLWHVGRVSHPVFLNGQLPLAPSAIPSSTLARTKEGKLARPIPKAMSPDDIQRTIEDFVTAAQNAIKAGFDGVEIHGANGYLINQFLCDGSNHRTDGYGGDIPSRSRFALEIVSSVCDAIGSERTAIRLSPGGIGNDISDSDPKSLYEFLIGQLDKMDLAYLHLLEPYQDLSHLPNTVQHIAKHFRPMYHGTLMINNGFNFQTANQVIEDGHADLVSFGKLLISNPDLVERFRKNAPLNAWDEQTFYSEGAEGFLDYPMLQTS